MNFRQPLVVITGILMLIASTASAQRGSPCHAILPVVNAIEADARTAVQTSDQRFELVEYLDAPMVVQPDETITVKLRIKQGPQDRRADVLFARAGYPADAGIYYVRVGGITVTGEQVAAVRKLVLMH